MALDEKPETTEISCNSCEATAGVDYYCDECKIFICPKCALVVHKIHHLLEVQTVLRQQRNAIITVVDRIKQEIPTLQEAMTTEEQHFKDVEEGIVETRKVIKAKVDELIQILRDQEIDLLIQLDDLYEDQLQTHRTRQQTLQLTLEHMASSVEYTETILGRENAPEIISVKDAIVERCEGLLSGAADVPQSTAFLLDFEDDEEYWQTVQKTPPGRITLQLAEQPGEGEEAGAGGLHYTSEAGNESFIDISQRHLIFAESDSAVGGVDAFEKDFTLVWQNTSSSIGTGEEELLTSSDRVVSPPYQPSHSFGRKGDGEGEFCEPHGIAVDKNGEIIVADTGNSRVQCFSAVGTFLHEFGSRELTHPLSVALSNSSDVILVDSANGILRFSQNGSRLRAKFAPDTLKSPRSVSIAQDGKVIVCDQEDKKVKIFSPDGETFLNSLAAPDYAVCPCYACFHNDRYFVTYTWQHCVKVFDEAGLFLYNIGKKGVGEGKFLYPAGVAVDHMNNLVVCDCANNRLQAFSLEGEFLYKLGGGGSNLGEFQHPEFVAFDADEQMYVVERNNHRVQVFRGKPVEFLIWHFVASQGGSFILISRSSGPHLHV